jgi:signal peptidase II
MHIIIVVITLLSCVGCDQLTKVVVRENLSQHKNMSFAGGTLRIQYAENKGAFLGMGASLPEKLRTFLFLSVIGITVLGILTYLLLNPTLSHRTTIALSLIAGGGLGNMSDRVVYNGNVVDFLNIGLGSLRTGIFNIADVAIMAGAAFLLIGSIRHTKTA